MSFRSVILALSALVAVAPVAAKGDDLENRVRAEILPSFRAMQAAANIHDAAAHVAFYAKDPKLLFVIGDRRIVGWHALLEQQRKWWPEGRMPPESGANAPYRLIAGPNIIVLDARAALLSFTLDAPKADAKGEIVDRTLAISQLWQKRPEGWRITYAQEAATLK